MKKYIFYIVLTITFSGCYPIHKTIQLKSEMMVVDKEGKPVKDAKVYLISSANPHNREKSRNMIKTDSTGVAKFDKIKEWRIEFLMIHGADSYFWNWCVKKEGYKTHTDIIKNKFEKKKRFILIKGKSEDCPKNFR
ncbi:MAG: hypothetical protein L3J20_14025 [Flavobacteriaceae bacterium]|nr:hypothetical protein [Flavobacteriaceae bacterium]